MPSIVIRALAGRSAEQKNKLLLAVRSAVDEAFDRKGKGGCYLWLEEYSPENCLLPSGEEETVVVNMYCFAGRSAAQKARLYELMAGNFRSVNESADDLLLIISDPPDENWGLKR